MIPLSFSSVAMRRVEYPGRSMTKTCPETSDGMNSAHANQPAAATTASKKSHTILRTICVV
jgi:hypothetical protein